MDKICVNCNLKQYPDEPLMFDGKGRVCPTDGDLRHPNVLWCGWHKKYVSQVGTCAVFE